MYSVYALVDPRDGNPRYVGMSKQVYTRYGQHLASAHNIVKTQWIATLTSKNLVPTLRILETMETEKEAREQEQHWISFYTQAGYDLANKEAKRGENTREHLKDSPLNRYRLELGWSIAELARHAGMSNATALRALLGKSVSGRTATALANAISKGLGQTIHYTQIRELNVKL